MRTQDHVRRIVDEALDPAWKHERQRALRRWVVSTVARVATGLLVLWVVGSVLHLPWTFLGFMGFLMTALAFSQTEGRDHLRRDVSPN
jgi:hypothetical protein